MHFAFNGWSLARDGEPSAALHLADLLERLPGLAPQHRYTLLLPPSEASISYKGVDIAPVPAGQGEWARLWLEQRRLPRMAGSLGADLLYYPYSAAPLASPVRVVAWSGCGAELRAAHGLVSRLRAGLGSAGLTGAAARISSAGATAAAGARHIPPIAPRAFGPDERPGDRAALGRYGLTESYVLADGVGSEEIGLLLAAWTWVNSAMGDAFDLLILADRRTHSSELRRRTESLGLEDSVKIVEGVRADDIPAIYRGAEAFLFAGQGYPTETLPRALASGGAIVGVEIPEAADLIGPAGYLVKGRDARLLGAACITVLAEPDMRERLRSRARERGEPLRSDAPLRALLHHLEDVVGTGSRSCFAKGSGSLRSPR